MTQWDLRQKCQGMLQCNLITGCMCVVLTHMTEAGEAMCVWPVGCDCQGQKMDFNITLTFRN